MIRLFILTFFSTLTLFNAQAQIFEAPGLDSKVSEKVKGDYTYPRKLIMGNNSFFYLNYVRPKLSLIKYDIELNEEIRLDIVPEILPRKSIIHEVLAYKRKLVIAYSNKNEDKEIEVGLLILDQEDLTVVENLKAITQYDKKSYGRPQIKLAISPNKMFIGLISFNGTPSTPTKPYLGIDDEVFRSVVFDSTFNIIANNICVLPADLTFSDLLQFEIDNKQNFFPVIRDGEFYILKFGPHDNEMVKHVLNIPGQIVKSMQLRINSMDSLVILGTCSEKQKYTVDGLFFQKINSNTLDTLSINVISLQDSFIFKNLKPMQISAYSRSGGFNGPNFGYAYGKFNVLDLVERNNRFYITMELSYVNVVDGNVGTNQSSGSVKYHYYDLLVASFTMDGELLWKRKMVKHQSNVNYRYGGTHCFISRDRIRLLFEAPGNKVKSYTGPKIKGNHLFLWELDTNGVGNLNALGKIGSNTFIPMMLKAVNDGKDNVVFYSGLKLSPYAKIWRMQFLD